MGSKPRDGTNGRHGTDGTEFAMLHRTLYGVTILVTEGANVSKAASRKQGDAIESLSKGDRVSFGNIRAGRYDVRRQVRPVRQG